MESRFHFFSKTPPEWSEGLPVLSPTYKRVKKMLNNDWNKRNEVYAYIHSMDKSFTYYQLASNAVLAGCTPDCWKIIKTCVNILIDQKFNLETVVTTVHSQSPLILISGKVANDLNIDVFNPCNEKNFNKILINIKKYDGLIWGGSSLNIYNDCIEIKRQISFMKECFKNIKDNYNNKFYIGEPIYITDIQSLLSKTRGVVDVKSVKIKNIHGGDYSSTTFDFSKVLSKDASHYKIPKNVILELRFPDKDLKGKVK